MAPSFMKSFKVLALLTLAATLSCGSPTNVIQATGSTDGFIKVIKRNTQAKDLLADAYLNPIINAARTASNTDGSEFTKNFVAGMWDNNQNYNYVVCSTTFATDFRGVEGVNWAIKYITTAKYTLFIVDAGRFIRTGKSGYKYWAWKGAVEDGQDIHSNVIHFRTPGLGGVESGGD